MSKRFTFLLEALVRDHKEITERRAAFLADPEKRLVGLLSFYPQLPRENQSREPQRLSGPYQNRRTALGRTRPTFLNIRENPPFQAIIFT
jgi:hypothetical protein